jgi:hypothetical protein
MREIFIYLFIYLSPKQHGQGNFFGQFFQKKLVTFGEFFLKKILKLSRFFEDLGRFFFFFFSFLLLENHHIFS